MKIYLTIIRYLQKIFLAISLTIMGTLPVLIVFYPDSVNRYATALYSIAHIAALFVMTIRPLADMLPSIPVVRPLVILRKGVGVLSASIVISFTFAKIIIDPSGFFGSVLAWHYWSLEGYALLAHLADISALLLLITSNNFSKRILGKWWKRIQRLSYVYFFASALFVYLAYHDMTVAYYMYIVASLTILAFTINTLKRYEHNTQHI